MLSSIAKYTLRPVVAQRSLKKPSLKPLTSVSRGPKRPTSLRALSLASASASASRSLLSQSKISKRSYSSHPPNGDDHSAPEQPQFAEDGKKIYTRKEVAEHNTRTDAWIIIDTKVYNVSTWIEFHPGGQMPLMERLGQDASTDFHNIGHSHRAKEVLDSLHIGHVRDKKRYTMR